MVDKHLCFDALEPEIKIVYILLQSNELKGLPYMGTTKATRIL